MGAVVSGAAVDMLGCRCSGSGSRGADAGVCASLVLRCLVVVSGDVDGCGLIGVDSSMSWRVRISGVGLG